MAKQHQYIPKLTKEERLFMKDICRYTRLTPREFTTIAVKTMANEVLADYKKKQEAKKIKQKEESNDTIQQTSQEPSESSETNTETQEVSTERGNVID